MQAGNVCRKGVFMEQGKTAEGSQRAWVEPEIRELEVKETFAFPGTGADAGGNPAPDCQRS